MSRRVTSASLTVAGVLLTAWVIVLAQDSFVRGSISGSGITSTGSTYTLIGTVGESFFGGGDVRPGIAPIISVARIDVGGSRIPGGSGERRPGESGFLSGHVQGGVVTLTFVLLDGSPATLTLNVSSDGRMLTGKGILPMGDVTISMTRSTGSASDFSGTYAVDFGGDDLEFTLTQAGSQLTGFGEPRDTGPPPVHQPPDDLVVASGSFDGVTATLFATIEEGPLTLTLTLSTDGSQLSGFGQVSFGQLPLTFTIATRTGPDPLDGIWEAFDEGELITLDLVQTGTQIQTRVPGHEPPLPAPIALELGYLLYLFEVAVDENADGLVNVDDFVLSLGALGGGSVTPGGSDRVKVDLPVLSGDETTYYAAEAFGGDDLGSFFLPEVEDEVLVGFLAADPGLPFVLGQTYSGTDAPAVTDAGGGRVVARGKVEAFDSATGSFLLSDLAGLVEDTRVIVSTEAMLFVAEEPFIRGAGSPWGVIAGDAAYWELIDFSATAFDNSGDSVTLGECDLVVMIGSPQKPEYV